MTGCIIKLCQKNRYCRNGSNKEKRKGTETLDWWGWRRYGDNENKDGRSGGRFYWEPRCTKDCSAWGGVEEKEEEEEEEEVEEEEEEEEEERSIEHKLVPSSARRIITL